ncbi:MAG: hypothetical protein AAB866_02640 [Patescibacteria group bacterium]
MSDEGAKKTKTGQRSTDAETLELLSDRHAIVKEILHYREIFKIKSNVAHRPSFNNSNLSLPLISRYCKIFHQFIY